MPIESRGAAGRRQAAAARARTSSRVAVRLAVLLLISLAGPGAFAASDDALESLASVVGNQASSPIPLGWVAGGAGYTGTSPYQADSSSVLGFPGAIYMSPNVMYLGDRASATFYTQGMFRAYARGRLRFDSLNPDDHPEWTGLHARLWEVEAGAGAQWLTPAGIVTVRGDSDVMGRSRGQDGLLSMDFPLIRGRVAVMPSLALVWRSSNLANYYYGGVSHGEATSEHPYYDVGAALSLSTSVVVSYRFDRRWLGALVTDYERYPGAIRNSPLVGKSGTYDLLVGAGYVF